MRYWDRGVDGAVGGGDHLAGPGSVISSQRLFGRVRIQSWLLPYSPHAFLSIRSPTRPFGALLRPCVVYGIDAEVPMMPGRPVNHIIMRAAQHILWWRLCDGSNPRVNSSPDVSQQHRHREINTQTPVEGLRAPLWLAGSWSR